MAPKAASLPYPPRVPLARTPTPLEPLKRMSARLGVDLYVKRDDLTGVELTGNKVRKLEFVMADALKQKADIVLTCGGAQSNHSRASAIPAARLGRRSRLILRTPDPFNPPAVLMRFKCPNVTEELIMSKIQERQQARENKDWAAADAIRKELD